MYKQTQSTWLKTLFLPFMVLSFLLFTSAQAQAQAKTESYAIEVIVFEHLALKGWTEEYWPEEIDRPNLQGSTSVFTRGAKPLWINKSGRSLGGSASKLNKQGYRVLFHQAWTQVAYADKKSPTVLIENDQKVGSNLVGTVRLYKTRFAHVDFDLEFERRIPVKVLEDFMKNQNLATTESPTHWRFHLKESRKIKPGELHYIDHPLFGVLVKITPLN